jgi:hypothetical protein
MYIIIMNKEYCRVQQWVKEHNKELLIATSIGIVVIIAAVCVTRCGIHIGDIKKFQKDRLKVASSGSGQNILIGKADGIEAIRSGTTKNPHDVKSHVRNLPKNQKASKKKIDEAASLGINLSERQTLVDSYRTGNNVA